VGVQRVGGDHRAGQLQAGQQWGERGDLAGGAVGLALGEHRAGGMVHRSEQMDLPTVWSGAPQRLAVDRDRPSPLAGMVAAGQPRADHRGQRRRIHAGQGPADRGLGRHRPAVGADTPSAERGAHRLGGVGGPLRDRGHRPSAGQDRGSGDRKDRGQRMPAAAVPSRVVDGGKVGEQMRRVGRS
jgi:hypothetical protein